MIPDNIFSEVQPAASRCAPAGCIAGSAFCDAVPRCCGASSDAARDQSRATSRTRRRLREIQFDRITSATAFNAASAHFAMPPFVSDIDAAMMAHAGYAGSRRSHANRSPVSISILRFHSPGDRSVASRQIAAGTKVAFQRRISRRFGTVSILLPRRLPLQGKRRIERPISACYRRSGAGCGHRGIIFGDENWRRLSLVQPALSECTSRRPC